MKKQQQLFEDKPEPDPIKRDSLDGFKLFFEELPADSKTSSVKRLKRRSRSVK